MALLALLDGLRALGVRSYKPGQSERFPITVELDGVLVDAPGLTFTLHDPNGGTSTGTLVHDSLGTYHDDYAFSLAAVPGVWVRRWQSSGGSASNDALSETRFVVEALDF